MKTKLLGFIATIWAIAILAFVFWPAKETQAQGYYSPAALLINATNCVAGATTNTVAATISTGSAKELAIGFTGRFLSAGVSNIVVTLTKSVDNINFEPAASGLILTWIGNGTNVLTSVTNFSIAAVPFYRVTVGNASAAGFDCTNTALHYSLK
jgi:hypothetical protein